MPQPQSRRPIALAALAVLAAAALLLVWSPWSRPQPFPGATTATDAPAATGSARPLATDITGAAAATPQDGEPRANTAPPTRQEVAARTVVRGSYAIPFGAWARDGQVALVKAPREMRGAMGMASLGMEVARREALERADRAAGKTATRHDSKKDVYEMIGRGAPVMVVPLDAEGAFVFEDPPAGAFQIVLDHPVLLNRAPVIFDVIENETRDLGMLDTRSGASLLVLVANAAGEPVPGAALELGRPVDMSQFMDPGKLGELSSLMPRLIPWEQRADDRGAFTFRGLPIEDPFVLEASAPGFVTAYRSFRLPAGKETVITLALAAGAVLEARVHDAGNGAAIAGIDVDVRYPERLLPARMLGLPEVEQRTYRRRATSDADGVARLTGLPTGRAVVSIDAAGFFPHEQQVTIADRGEVTPLELRLDRGVTITGHLVDEAGAAVPHGRVLAVEPSEEGSAIFGAGEFMRDMHTLRLYEDGITADDDGSFVIGGFRAGESTAVAAVAPGFDRTQSAAVTAGTDGVEIVLHPLAELRGVVLADADEQPVPAFRVELKQRAFMMFERTVLGEDYAGRDDGAFALTNAPRDRFDVEVTAEGYAPWQGSADCTAGSVDLGEVRLLAPASVAGVTVDAAGNAVAGASVRISRGGVADSLMMSQMLGSEVHTSDENGHFEITGLTAKRVRLIADKAGHATVRSRPLPLQPGACTADVVLELGTGGSLRGRLVDGVGEPLAGWRAQATHTSGVSMNATTTDDDGRFALDGLMPGPTKVDCMPADYVGKITGASEGKQLGPGDLDVAKTIGRAMQWIASDRVTLRSGETCEVELVFHGPDGAVPGSETTRVEGTVRIGGRPLAAGMLFLTPAGSTELGRITEIEDGDFELPHLPPGTYSCRVQASMLSGNVGRARTVEIPAAPTFRLDLDLPGGAIAGVVRDGTGQPVPGVAVVLSSAATGDAAVALDRMDVGEGSVLTDTSGRFQFEGLTGGRYQLLARELLAGQERSAGQVVELPAGSALDELALNLDSGGDLVVRVRLAGLPRTNSLVTLLDAFGNPLALFHRQLTQPDGSVRLGGLPANADYRVAVDTPGAAPQISSPVRIAADGEAVLDVELVPGVAATLRLEGELPQLGSEMISYEIRRADGALLRSGQVMWTAAAPDAVPSALPLGRLSPGRYSIRVASPRLGVLRGEHEIAGGAASTWSLQLPH